MNKKIEDIAVVEGKTEHIKFNVYTGVLVSKEHLANVVVNLKKIMTPTGDYADITKALLTLRIEQRQERHRTLLVYASYGKNKHAAITDDNTVVLDITNELAAATIAKQSELQLFVRGIYEDTLELVPGINGTLEIEYGQECARPQLSVDAGSAGKGEIDSYTRKLNFSRVLTEAGTGGCALGAEIVLAPSEFSGWALSLIQRVKKFEQEGEISYGYHDGKGKLRMLREAFAYTDGLNNKRTLFKHDVLLKADGTMAYRDAQGQEYVVNRTVEGAERLSFFASEGYAKESVSGETQRVAAELSDAQRNRAEWLATIRESEIELHNRGKLFTQEYNNMLLLDGQIKNLSAQLEEYSLNADKAIVEGDDIELRNQIGVVKKNLLNVMKRHVNPISTNQYDGYTYIESYKNVYNNELSKNALLAQMNYDIAVDNMDDTSCEEIIKLNTARKDYRRTNYLLNDRITDLQEMLNDLSTQLESKNNSIQNASVGYKTSLFNLKAQILQKQNELRTLTERLKAESEEELNELSKGRLQRNIQAGAQQIVRLDAEILRLSTEHEKSKQTEILYCIADGQTTLFFNQYGNAIESEIGGEKLSYVYTGEQLNKITDEDGNALYSLYYDKGLLTAIVAPDAEKTRFQYNSNNRLSEIISADGSVCRYNYNDSGALLEALDCAGRGIVFQVNCNSLVEGFSAVTYAKSIVDGAVTKGDKLEKDCTQITRTGDLVCVKCAKSTQFYRFNGGKLVNTYCETVAEDGAAWCGKEVYLREENREIVLTEKENAENLLAQQTGALINAVESYTFALPIENMQTETKYIFSLEAAAGCEHNVETVIEAETHMTVAGVAECKTTRFNVYPELDGQLLCVPIFLQAGVESASISLKTPLEDASGLLLGAPCLKETAYCVQEKDEKGNIFFSDENGVVTRQEFTDGVLTAKTVCDKTGVEKRTEYSYTHDVIRTVCTDGTAQEMSFGKDFVKKTVFSLKNSGQRQTEEKVFDEKGRLLCDSSGKSVETGEPLGIAYAYDEDCVIEKHPNGQTVRRYEKRYEDGFSAISACVDGIENETKLSYTADLLTRVVSGETEYGFAYDGFSRCTAFAIGDSTVMKYTYEDGVTTETYADGTSKSVLKDTSEKPVRVLYADTNGPTGEYVAYEYEKLTGNVKKRIDCIDTVGYNECNYTYDKDGNKSSVTAVAHGTAAGVAYTYDEASRLKSVTVDTGESTEEYGFQYGFKKEAVTLPNGTSHHIFKDELGRTEKITKGDNYSAAFAYADNGSRASKQVSRVRYTVNGIIGKDVSYVYDNVGNVTEVLENGKTTVRYTYDGISRLVREENTRLNKAFTTRYDNMGNIIEKAIYALDTQTSLSVKKYAYDSMGRMTSFGEDAFSYTGVSLNPSVYRKNQTEWVRGNRLRMLGNTSFKYDANNNRVAKNTNGKAVSYTVLDGIMLKETSSDGVITYVYGADGITGFRFNGKEYAYGKNICSDVTELYEVTQGKWTLIASYLYDAWGNTTVLSADGSESTNQTFIGNTNPIRYRSYYYDPETSLYYTPGRYYDPEAGRWINADEIENAMMQIDQINGLNLYAYCLNNPIRYTDPTGQFVITGTAFFIALLIGIVAGAAVGGTVAGVQSYQAGNRGLALFGDIAGGALMGGAFGVALVLGGAAGLAATGATIAGFGLSTFGAFGISVGVTAAAGMGAYSIKQGTHGKEWKFGEFALAGLKGGLQGAMTFGAGYFGGRNGLFDKMLGGDITNTFGKLAKHGTSANIVRQIFLGTEYLIGESLTKVLYISSAAAGIRKLIDWLFSF